MRAGEISGIAVRTGPERRPRRPAESSTATPQRIDRARRRTRRADTAAPSRPCYNRASVHHCPRTSILPQSPIPAPSVLAGMRQALKPHAPFAAMSEGDLDRIVRASQLRYFAPGEIDPCAGGRAARALLRDPAGHRPRRAARARAAPRPRCGSSPPAKCFRWARCIARRGVTSVYRATQDTFCLAFPGRRLRRADRDLAGLPGLLHAPARAPARPVATRLQAEYAADGHRAARARRRRSRALLRQAPVVLRSR